MYALVVPGAIATDLTIYGTKRTVVKDGWISKTDVKNGWHIGPTLKYAHKWASREKAEGAALIISGFVPKALGRMIAVEVVRHGKGTWRRAMGSESPDPTLTNGPAGPCVTPSTRTGASSSGS